MESRGMGASDIASERTWPFAWLGLGTRTRAWLPPQGSLAVAALPPLAIALLAAFFQPLRPAMLLIAVAATLLTARRRAATAWAWAATVPLISIFTWGLLPRPTALPALASCASLLSGPMVWRVAELTMVLGVTALLVRWLVTAPPPLPIDRQPRSLVAATAIAGLAIVPLALVVGQEASKPFFGVVRVEIGLAGAIVPALVFAAANATLEETVYRGVLLGWLEPALGTTGAIIAQAAAFGLAHNGTDYIASPLPVILAMFASGLLAGLVVKRSGSLLLVIVLHAAFDVPLYYSLACRVT